MKSAMIITIVCLFSAAALGFDFSLTHDLGIHEANRLPLGPSLQQDLVSFTLIAPLQMGKNPKIDQTSRSLSYNLPMGYFSGNKIYNGSRKLTLQNTDVMRMTYNPIFKFVKLESQAATDVNFCYVQGFSNEKSITAQPGDWYLKPIRIAKRPYYQSVANTKTEMINIEFLMKNEQDRFLISCVVVNLSSDSTDPIDHFTKYELAAYFLSWPMIQNFKWWSAKNP